MPSISISMTATLSQPDSAAHPERLAALPQLPRYTGGPVRSPGRRRPLHSSQR
jgi:hypothetical protein